MSSREPAIVRKSLEINKDGIFGRGKGSIDYAVDLMEYAEVSITPGRAFGEGGEDYMRIALVENEQRLRQAVRNISRYVRKSQ